MNDPLMWFWFGCAFMMLIWVAIFYRQRYIYRAKRMKVVSRYRTWLHIKRMIIQTNYGVAKSLNMRIANVEKNNREWDETCKALRKTNDATQDRNRSLEKRSDFLERKCKAIATIINTGYVPARVPMNQILNCIHCRELGLSYCISDVLHGKKSPEPSPELGTFARSFQPIVRPDVCLTCSTAGFPYCVCWQPERCNAIGCGHLRTEHTEEDFFEGKSVRCKIPGCKCYVYVLPEPKQGGSDASPKQEEERSSCSR